MSADQWTMHLAIYPHSTYCTAINVLLRIKTPHNIYTAGNVLRENCTKQNKLFWQGSHGVVNEGCSLENLSPFIFLQSMIPSELTSSQSG